MNRPLHLVDFRESVWPPGITSGSNMTKSFRVIDSMGNATGFELHETDRDIVIAKGGDVARYPLSMVARLVDAKPGAMPVDSEDATITPRNPPGRPRKVALDKSNDG